MDGIFGPRLVNILLCLNLFLLMVAAFFARNDLLVHAEVPLLAGVWIFLDVDCWPLATYAS